MSAKNWLLGFGCRVVSSLALAPGALSNLGAWNRTGKRWPGPADGIMAVHPTIDGWTRDELVEALAYWRRQKKDIKRVWESGRRIEGSDTPTGKWTPEPSKVKLAEALWPTLLKKIQLYMTTKDAPVPPIAAVVNDAYHIALRWRDQSYVLTEVPQQAAQAGTASSDQ